MYYNAGSPILEPGQTMASHDASSVNEGTPQFRDIYLKNITCRGAARAVQIEGLPEMPIRGITLDNVRISAKSGIGCVDAEQIEFKNVTIDTTSGPVIAIKDSRNVTLDKVSTSNAPDTFLKIDGEKTGEVKLANTDLSRAKTPIEFGKGAREGAVVRN